MFYLGGLRQSDSRRHCYATYRSYWLDHLEKNYKGSKGKLFLNKIRISFGMIALSIVLLIYQTVFPFDFLGVWHRLGHFLYFGGVTLLMMGAAAEGYYGGRLHHR